MNTKSQDITLPPIKPLALVCFICGGEYGTASIDIHLRFCEQRWDRE
jgi:hypothetical protein